MELPHSVTVDDGVEVLVIAVKIYHRRVACFVTVAVL